MKLIITTMFCFLLATTGFSQNYFWQLKQSGNSLGGPIDVEKFNSDNVYYGSSNRVYRSTDRGDTFTQMGNLIPNSSAVKSVTVNDNYPGTIVVA